MIEQFARAYRFVRARVPFADPVENKVAIVCGTGRSGTTWLAEQLAYATFARIIFEPLHPAANKGRQWVGKRAYLRANDPAPAWRAVIDPIVHGTLRNRWTDRYNARYRYRFRVVKMIRANLMLGWLAHNYPQARIALVIRDPVDVAKSQLRGGWPIELGRFTAQAALMEDYPILNSELLAAADSQFELNVLHWAIENRVALDQLEVARARGARVEVFSYHVLRDDTDRFQAFLEFCGTPNDIDTLRHMRRPSRVSRSPQPVDAPTPEQRAFAVQVANAFELTAYLAPQQASLLG